MDFNFNFYIKETIVNYLSVFSKAERVGSSWASESERPVQESSLHFFRCMILCKILSYLDSVFNL